MANPPIVIGPFANVPAPGSPIRSDWAQQVSTVVTKHEAWTAVLSAAVAGPEVTVFSGGSVAAIGNVSVVSAGNYLAFGSCGIVNRGAGIAQVSVNMRVAGANVGQAQNVWLNAPAEQVEAAFFALVNLAAGARALEIGGVAASGTPAIAARQIFLLRVQ